MSFKMDQFMMDNGRTIKCMVKDVISIEVEINTKVNL